MTESQLIRLAVPRVLGLWLAAVLALLPIGIAPNLAAQEKPAGPTQEQIIVYVHTVATSVSIAVNDLTIYKTESVFGVWNYQFNISSWLDTEPQTLTVKANFGNRDKAYCTVEVRRVPVAKPAVATVLAEKMMRGNEVEKKGNRTVSVISLDITRPKDNVRPLWADHSQVDLRAVTRKQSVDLVQEVFEALQSCNLEMLKTLIDPALNNQALMEGADPELVKQSFLALLKRDCIPRITVAETMDAYYKTAYEDVMAPLDFEKMIYKFSLDESREDKRGNLYTPKKPITIKNRYNEKFVARPFLSYTDDKRNRRFISRFVFQRTQ